MPRGDLSEQHDIGLDMNAEPGLAASLRRHTASLHRAAERGGIVRQILAGRATRAGYALFMRNLLPAYAAMEAGLRVHRDAPGVRLISNPALERVGTIRADLTVLVGPEWEERLELLPSGTAYATRIGEAARADPARLVGHAYTRVMGDLSGARFLRRSLTRAPGLEPAALSFYEFTAIGDADAFKVGYRAALDAVALEVADPAAVLDEAAIAFACNIAVSEAVQQRVG
jgi:heme oxygenase